jgi:hypothetical protein
MNLNITVDLGEGPFNVSPSLAAVVDWERRFKAKVGNSAFGLEDLMYLAYVQIKADKTVPVPPAFDDFIARVKSIEAENGDDDPRPTEVATATPSA